MRNSPEIAVRTQPRPKNPALLALAVFGLELTMLAASFMSALTFMYGVLLPSQGKLVAITPGTLALPVACVLAIIVAVPLYLRLNAPIRY